MPRIRFEPDGNEIDVPAGTTILQAAQKANAMVGYACGGVCACSTCHVHVKDGLDDLEEADEREEDILEKAFDVQLNSRLSCQVKLTTDRDYVVEITRESRKAYLDEHPDLRDKQKADGGG